MQVNRTAVNICTYDNEGNRVSETAGVGTTNYLVDTQNPTGYAQVVDELQNGAVTRSYSYGLERISQNWQPATGNWQLSFYGYDGHGSVRQLTNAAGAVTDSYDYDAFGNLTNSTGSTPNNYLFAGEQFDPALGLYYNRARYYNQQIGRFWSMDTYEGNDRDPLSLHKYLYAGSDPVDILDPSGNDGMDGLNPWTILGLFGGGSSASFNVYPVVVVTTGGSSNTPTTNVKNPAQSSISGIPVRFPMRIAVPSDVDPQALVNQWRRTTPPTPWTYLHFAAFWSPGGKHDYKLPKNEGPNAPIYDAFGNFEYGATGAAAGFDLETLEGAGELAHGGTNSLINEADIDEGFEAIKNGGTLSKRLESLSLL
jgi:RHS repeat-associated protein